MQAKQSGAYIFPALGLPQLEPPGKLTNAKLLRHTHA